MVLFCGAGISYPAGLPGFKGLVNTIYDRLGTHQTDIEKAAFDKDLFDATLDLLERRLTRADVRKALNASLKPNYRKKGATSTHTALLDLSKARDGGVRLVTTNFDRIFLRLIDKAKLGIPSFAAPLLPIPKSSRWHGVVYLHGLLPEPVDENGLNRLVVTSGDFGLAYLIERWAARFVSDLFRNYIVCFVGYSINDPVLRYMMDALAADKMLGETVQPAYAFGDFDGGNAVNKKVEWEAKGVIPILYHVPPGSHDHSALHDTIQAWAATYRDGVRGKERIVNDYALAHPTGSTPQDDYVGRMLWALSHESGLPAQLFADLDPVPPLSWLGPLSQPRFRHDDLTRFGVAPNAKIDEKLAYSILERPSPYTHAPFMSVLAPQSPGAWDDVMAHLARWLVRHLGDPELALWMAKRSGALQPGLAQMIESRIAQLSQWEKADPDRLKKEVASASNCRPTPFMEFVWRLFIAGRVKTPRRQLNLDFWFERNKGRLSSGSARTELRNLLTPYLQIREPLRFRSEGTDGTSSKPQEQLDCNVELAADSVYHSLQQVGQYSEWKAFLPHFLGDAEMLLKDALDLMGELGEANELADRSHWDMPSISRHFQNRGFRDWVALIEIVRDAWLLLLELNPEQAGRAAQAWSGQKFPIFIRLALFAAAHLDASFNEWWLRLLLANDGWWLWSVDTQREVARLLASRGGALEASHAALLEEAILQGPPRRMYREEATADQLAHIADSTQWLRLAKLREAGVKLVDAAADRLGAIEHQHPHLQLLANEQEEFSHWMGGSGDPGYRVLDVIRPAPRDLVQLLEWLRLPPVAGAFEFDDWSDVCRSSFEVAIDALGRLANRGEWPTNRWTTALQIWSDDQFVRPSWDRLADVLSDIPHSELVELIQPLSWWLQAVAKVLSNREETFLQLCTAIILNGSGADATGEHKNNVSFAINQPVGFVTQALLTRWFARHPEDGQGLSDDLRGLFRLLADDDTSRYRSGRVLLAANVIALFRVDREWTEQHVLPRFHWATSAQEAIAMWHGFLWSPRLYRPLLLRIKSDFLACAQNFDALGEFGSQFATFLTFNALDRGDTFTEDELRTAMAELPLDALKFCTQALVRALEGAGDQRPEYWRNRLHPYIHRLWPKSNANLTPPIAGDFARLCLAAGDAFPDAIEVLRGYLRAAEYPDSTIHLAVTSKLAERFPARMLQFLDLLISNDVQYLSRDLESLLTEIKRGQPELEQDSRYIRLIDLYRRRKIG